MTKPLRLGPQHRNINLRDGIALDVESRTLTMTFSSEAPVDRWYGKEVLSHERSAARLSRLNDGAPLLFNHNMDDVIGVVEQANIGGDRRGHSVVRFAKTPRGDEIMGMVADGILRNVSFMYRIFKVLEDAEADTYTATDWEAYEISLVTIPADPTIGVGRATGVDEMDVIIESRSAQNPAAAETQEGTEMFNKRKFVLQDQAADGAAGGSAGGASVVELKAARVQSAEAERARIIEIEALCKQHKIDDEMRRGFITKDATIEEARGAVLDVLLKKSTQPAVDLGSSANPDLTEKEKSKYSMLRAIRASLDNNWKEAGLELEVSNEIAKRTGRSSGNGFFMPTNLQFAMRAPYAAGATATGGAIVATNLLAGSFIEILRNKARVMQLGATVLSGLVGNVDIPRQNGASSTYWVTEGAALSESEATFDKVSLSMKHIGTWSQISRNMLMQSTPDIEMLVRADLIAQIALGVDLAALSGTGSGGQPTGIANVTGIGSVVGGTNGAQITIDNLIDLETAVANANADVDNMSYLANAKTIGWLKKLKSSTGQYLWSTDTEGQRSGTPGSINGYGVARSNQARSNLTKGTATGVCSEIFFGNWSELLVGEWGVLEILPNPYDSTAYKAGSILIRAMQSLDLAVRHAASFATMSDGLTA